MVDFMEPVAFLFPGQGAQYVGMGKDLYDTYPEARNIFDHANKILNIPLTRYCFQGPAELLKQTIICQPAILTVSVAILEVLNSKIIPKFTAGLSLGEYTALVAAGALSFENALMLVHKRAEFMEEEAKQTKGKMAAVLGLEKDKLEKLCNQTKAEIANLNCPGQIVISGSEDSIDKTLEILRAEGVKTVVLEVSGGFHSSLMSRAADKLKQVLDRTEFKQPQIKVVSNVSAKPQSSVDEIRKNLYKQMTSAVRWQDSIVYIVEQGIRSFFEIGPGKVLKGLLRKINSNLDVTNIETVKDIGVLNVV